jgi:hypothetical protein
VIAVAAAGVIVGGLGGAAIAHLAGESDRSEHGFSDRDGFPGGPFPSGEGSLPGGRLPGGPPNGQVPAVPRDEPEDQSSDSSEESSES